MSEQTIIVANWKMHGTRAFATEFTKQFSKKMQESAHKASVIICPSFLHVALVAAEAGDNLLVGAQDCYAGSSIQGPYTGDVSAHMLKEAGVSHVIVGHSERRHFHEETDHALQAKLKSLFHEDVVPIFCVGETLEERENGAAEKVVAAQLHDLFSSASTVKEAIIAYEPVWAIGTGKVPKSEDIEHMHSYIQSHVQEAVDRGYIAFEKPVKILYGGSVKPDNARELLAIPHVDGALVGGSSLDISAFWDIVQAAF